MKRFLSVVLVLFIVIGTVPAFEIASEAASGPVFEFALNSDGETYSVTKCSWSSGSKPFEATIPSTYNNKNVVSIGSEAFTSTGLLERLIIPDTITTIAEKAFYKNSILEYISFPESITSVGADAFTGCQLAVNISDIGKWCNINFADENANPLKGNGIYKSTLYLNNERLENLVIPSTVTEIKPFAFYGCYTIESLVISDSVKNMGQKAFYECGNLKSVKIGDNLTKISDYAFAYCDYLESVEIGSGVTQIGSNAFFRCESLNEVFFGENLKTIDSDAFSFCIGLISIILPDSVTTINSSAFYNCLSLKKVILPKNIEEIKPATFSYCTSLESIVIPEKVKKINNNAFYHCRSLTWIALYSNIESFGTDAFYYNDSIENIFYTGTRMQWKNISIPESNDYNNQYILDADVHYNCKETFVAPTCKNIGKTTFVCGNCDAQGCWGENIKQGILEIPALGHLFASKWTIDLNADCIKNGSKSRHCERCNEKTDITVIPAKGHIAVKDVAVAATCTTAGKTEGSHCSVCGEVVKAQTTIAAKGHKSSAWKTDKKATVDNAGSKHIECTECGEILETATIAQLKCSKPTLLSVSNTTSGVKVSWGKVSGADKYYVYRKTGSNGKYSKIATVKGNSKVTYTDKKAKSGKKYYYYVKAVNEAGSSDASKSKSILYLADTTLSTPKSTKNGVTLKWKKVTGAEGYVVYRKTGSGKYEKIATVKGNSKVTYTDKKAKKGKTYTYKIKAYKSKTTSAYSNAKKIKDKY